MNYRSVRDGTFNQLRQMEKTMRNRLITSVMATLMTVGLLSHVSAQQQVPRFPTSYSPSGGTGYHSHPFLPIPFEVDPIHWDEETDAQFFAPAELGDLGNPPPLRSGVFASYERMNLHLSRPNMGPNLLGLQFISPGPTSRFSNVEQHQPVGVDSGWGNRFTFGWGDEKGCGWLGRYERLQVASDYTSLFPTTEESAQVPFPQDIEDDEGEGPNIPNDGIPDGYAQFKNSANIAFYQNFELNRVIRLPRLYRGGVLEPYLGIRYTDFDHRHNETGFVYSNLGGPTIGIVPNPVVGVGGVITGPPGQIPVGNVSDSYHNLVSTVENEMFGGQLGLRWRNQIGRWKIGLDTRVFGLHNWQTATGTYSVYDFITTDESGLELEGVQANRTVVTDNNREFTFGGDLRAELGLQATRDISLIIAFQGMMFARGVSRDAIIPVALPDRFINSQESVYMGGVTFGVEYNK